MEPAESDFWSRTVELGRLRVNGTGPDVAVLPLSCGWSDLGSWDALADISDADEDSNVFIREFNAIDCAGTFANVQGIRVNAVSISNMIIVASGSEVPTMPRGQSQEVKELSRNESRNCPNEPTLKSWRHRSVFFWSVAP